MSKKSSSGTNKQSLEPLAWSKGYKGVKGEKNPNIVNLTAMQ